MKGPLSKATWIATGAVFAVAVALRILNVFRYPADWGYDARFNWQYIIALTRTWELPDPDAGWSTGDPPLYFYLAATVVRAIHWPFISVPLLGTAAGLGSVALAYALVRRTDPERPGRALLAAGLLLYLPAHIAMSLMVNEEIVGAFFTSAAVTLLATRADAPGLRRAAAVGLLAGLALLTKLTGAVAIATAAGTYALDGLRRGAWRPAAGRVLATVCVAALVGGWYFARNFVRFGYLQPYGLPAHQLMFTMPPGERTLLDYVRVPVATFSDPQLLNEDLLHSVWGSTYVTLWFDGHRMWLPRDDAAVSLVGTALLLLALLPTAAFAVGLWRGARRALRAPDGPDPPLLLLVLGSLAGYALYTWQNPWFAVLKGTSLLALAIPFAWYTSEVLADWTARRGAARLAICAALAALAALVVVSCTFGLVFEKLEVSGLEWRTGEAP